MDVAVKTLRIDTMGHGEKVGQRVPISTHVKSASRVCVCVCCCVQEFMREARIMVTLNHPCIVKLIGVTGGKPMMLVS